MARLSRFRTSLFILLLALGLLGGASWVLYGSLETDRLAEKARQERFMRNAAFSVVDDLGAELFTLYSAFSFDLATRQDFGETVDRGALERAIERYRAQARFPGLLQDLVCLTVTPDGYRLGLWDGFGWVNGVLPDWADLRVPSPREPPGRVPLRSEFSLEKPVLTIYRRNRGGQVGDVVAIALRFNAQVVLTQIVPTLVRQRFSESQDAQPYRAAVRNLGLGSVGRDASWDWAVPLLPSTAFEGWSEYYLSRLVTIDRSRLAFERVSPGLEELPRSGWTLTVQRLPDGLPGEMASLQARNFLLSLGFFLVLSFGFLGLWWTAIQTRRLSQQERTFLALISHELKTPLAVVRSLAENLAQGIGTTEARAREYGEVLTVESERLGRMIANVLALTAVQGGLSPRDRTPIDLERMLRERVAREERRGVELVVQIHPGLPQVLGHAAALSASIDNLVGNAFRHGVSGHENPRIRIGLSPLRRWGRRGVELVVEDNGPGFTREEGRMFRRPFRRGAQARESQVPGGGVGLSLVRVTAKALGGHLSWESSPGKGARFRLWLREAPP